MRFDSFGLGLYHGIVVCYGVRTYLARDIDILNLPAISSVPPFGVATSAQVATRHVNMSGLRTYEFRTALIDRGRSAITSYLYNCSYVRR